MMGDASRHDVPAPARPVALEGEIVVRVRYSECDPMGVAHHGSYVEWLEMGRTELLRTSGVSYAELEAAGALLAVTRIEIRYRAPARYDDVLVVRTRVSGGGRARIDHDYEVRRALAPGEDGGSGAGEVVATAETTLACIGRDGRVRALPEWLAPNGGRAGRRR